MSAFDQSDRAPVAFSRTSLWRRLVLRQLGEGVASRGALEPATGKGRIGCARSSSFCSCSQLAPPQANRPEPPLTGRRRLNGPSVPSAPLSARNSRVAAAQSSVPRARPRSVSPAVAPSTPAGDSYAWKTRAVRASDLSVDELAHWDCWGFHGELEHVNRPVPDSTPEAAMDDCCRRRASSSGTSRGTSGSGKPASGAPGRLG